MAPFTCAIKSFTAVTLTEGKGSVKLDLFAKIARFVKKKKTVYKAHDLN
jgi:hypothetical protein